jgi:hypothetical protein
MRSEGCLKQLNVSSGLIYSLRCFETRRHYTKEANPCQQYQSIRNVFEIILNP